jgi:cytochrome c oxidase assembly protein subunit 15
MLQPQQQAPQQQGGGDDAAKMEMALKMVKQVSIWVYIVCIMTVIMMVIGAITRLTDSGLSIVEWHVIADVIPPLTQERWQEVFNLYKTLPEFQLANPDYDLEDFKAIYWWEYIHRLWGRILGFVYILPLLYFLRKGAIPKGHRLAFFGVLCLAGAQALIGQWMVSSGTHEGRIDVAPQRLVVHLLLALMIFYYLLSKLVDIKRMITKTEPSWLPSPLLNWLKWNFRFLMLVIISGGLVAGLRAGLIYNEYPLMGGQFIPTDYHAVEQWYFNFIDNPVAAQWHHRLLTLLFALSSIMMAVVMMFVCGHDGRVAYYAKWIFATTLAQFAIGLLALLFVVPLALGVAHQLGAIALFVAYVMMIKEVIKSEDKAQQQAGKEDKYQGGDQY